MLLKTRVAKKGNTRLSQIKDKELLQSVFQPGTPIQYKIDPDSEVPTLLILESEEGPKVAGIQDGEVSCLDIRRKDHVAMFAEYDYLQITICEDHVKIEGYMKTEGEVEDSASPSVLSDIFPFEKKMEVIIPFQHLLEKMDGYEDLTPIPLIAKSSFSGAGMFDFAFKCEGFQIIWALELEPDEVKGNIDTYRYNIGEHIVKGNVMTYPLEKIPSAPVFIGCPSCKSFSNVNRSKKRMANHEDSNLVSGFIRLVKADSAIQVFAMENVAPMLTAKNGMYFHQMNEMLEDFEITEKVLNAASYGTAQQRKRAIVLGSKIGKILHPAATIAKQAYKTVREAFRGLHDSIPNQLDYSIPKDKSVQRYQHIQQGNNWNDIPEELRSKGRFANVYRRLEWDQPSIALPNCRKSQILHPEENRIVSVRESARLFGLPDSFEFKGKKNSNLQQVANGVPLELGRAIARVIREQIEKYNQSLKMIQNLRKVLINKEV